MNTDLQGLRKSAGLTQVQMAEALSVGQSAVSQWELGVTLPRLSMLLKLSELLGVPMDEVVRAIEASRKE